MIKMNKNKLKVIQLNNKSKKKVTMLQYNRPVDKKLVNKLKRSMEKYGVLSAVTVYEDTNEYKLVDGQHRWTAASELDLTIPAISISWDAMNAIVEMNTIQVNWTLNNFVDFFSVHANPEIKMAYSMLKSKKKEYPHLTYSSLSKIYGKPNTGIAFKAGKWRLTDVTRGDRIVSYLNDLKKHLPYCYSARFIHAYKDVASHGDYDHVRMMKKLNSKHNVSILTSSNPKNYGIMLTKIYNFKQTKKLVMFKASWI